MKKQVFDYSGEVEQQIKNEIAESWIKDEQLDYEIYMQKITIATINLINRIDLK